MNKEKKISIFLFFVKVFALVASIYSLEHLHSCTFHKPYYSEKDARSKVCFKTLRLLSEKTKRTLEKREYKAKLPDDKDGYSVKYNKILSKDQNLSFLNNYKNLNDDNESVDLSNKEVLLDVMNQIILREKILNYHFHNTKHSQRGENFNAYMDDVSCVKRIIDLSEKSRLYRSGYLRFKYKIFRYIRKCLNKIKLYLMLKCRSQVIKTLATKGFFCMLVQHFKKDSKSRDYKSRIKNILNKCKNILIHIHTNMASPSVS
ncbi:hypothetical protein POVWA2_015540 [Plasmodium ovale wallikeri]|uniref:Uncharacterized protein n=1 Tax=Plasmodium ovale wallikeri TaxID=864142 RepID=A0A1A8YNQ8_PLAOA|nr:hypothetical protein POVWA1_016040 [Plasmodium ovale wallikeri]SBT33584.1 hypothetical protein POVWA2_015540 [Plasmodium ovale wallikeri]